MHKIIKGEEEHALKGHNMMSSSKRIDSKSKDLDQNFERNKSSFRRPVMWNALPDTVKNAKELFQYHLKHKAKMELKTTTFIEGTKVTRNRDLKITFIINNFEPKDITG